MSGPELQKFSNGCWISEHHLKDQIIKLHDVVPVPDPETPLLLWLLSPSVLV